jgi:hypothetical protein
MSLASRAYSLFTTSKPVADSPVRESDSECLVEARVKTTPPTVEEAGYDDALPQIVHRRNVNGKLQKQVGTGEATTEQDDYRPPYFHVRLSIQAGSAFPSR